MVIFHSYVKLPEGIETVGTGLGFQVLLLGLPRACQGPGGLGFVRSNVAMFRPGLSDAMKSLWLIWLRCRSWLIHVDPTAAMRKHETTILGAYPIVS